MIYITGDTHNSEDMSNLSKANMELCCLEQKADYGAITAAIVLGDFGLPWHTAFVARDGIHPTSSTDKKLLAWYNKKPFKVLALMGNHDNYDMLKKLPPVAMFGSTVLKVSENVFYLKRGEVYTIEEKRFLVLGGALSVDKIYRIPHKSWWEEEAWSSAEEEALLAKIAAGERTFDYVLSHNGPTAGIASVEEYVKNGGEVIKDPVVAFNDQIDSMITYKKWFFGHWHSDSGYKNFKENKYIALYHEGVVV